MPRDSHGTPLEPGDEVMVRFKVMSVIAGREDFEDAQNELQELANRAGVDPEDVKRAKNWSQVRDLIDAARPADSRSPGDDEGAGDEPEPEEDDGTPRVGKVYAWKSDPKKRAVQVEAVSVDKVRKVCTVKNLATEKNERGVPFAALTPAT